MAATFSAIPDDPAALLWFIFVLLILIAAAVLRLIWLMRRRQEFHDTLVRIETRGADQLALVGNLERYIADLQHEASADGMRLREALRVILNEHQAQTGRRQTEAQHDLQSVLQSATAGIQHQVLDALARNSQAINQQVETLTKITDRRLQEIGGQVDQRLSDGFEKTSATFADVIKRLALIDEAQKRITELSSNVVSLQEILADKRSRGTFGEVQLAALVRNVLPEQHFRLQHKLANGRIADCMLLLPEPSGHIALDAKFPLESFRTMTDIEAGDEQRRQAQRQFKRDVRKHIEDIAERYIIAGETGDGAIMFVPAEAVFAEIQAHHAELVELAHRMRVWMVSPTTLWAVLNTAQAVLKDVTFREQLGSIRGHLAALADDFDRFRGRMEALSKHIEQAHRDVQDVNISARRISDRFGKIERADLEPSDRTGIEKSD